MRERRARHRGHDHHEDGGAGGTTRESASRTDSRQNPKERRMVCQREDSNPAFHSAGRKEDTPQDSDAGSAMIRSIPKNSLWQLYAGQTVRQGHD